MLHKYIILLGLTFIPLFVSCSQDTDLMNINPIEEFVDSDQPITVSHESFNVQTPWGYDKPENQSRNYPIVVSGRWGEGKHQYAAVAKDYPAFVIDYQKSSSSDGQALAVWIKSAIAAGYRIDLNRIYLTGFSWGGSGSYPLARGLHQENLFFAAIIRVAGQSQSDLGNEIAAKTAVWYHIGLNDEARRVDVARAALEYMRNYEVNAMARETRSADTIDGYKRTTITLTRSRFEMFKYSEYTDMGHTSGPCYTDTNLFDWLFSHSLALR